MTVLTTPTTQPQRRRVVRVAAAAVLTGLILTPVTISQLASAAPVQSPGTFNPVTVGARGPAVIEIQAALVASGVRLVGGVDGVFGPMTASALRDFQTKNGLSATGVVDQATAIALGLASAPRLIVNVGLARNATGASVADLQRALVGAGVTLAGGVDGVFGPATERALRQFQTQRGLEVTGSVTEATANALSGIVIPSQPTSLTTLVGVRIGAQGAAVRTIQQSLISAGITFPGGADGIYGPATANALRIFQSRAGLNVTGEVDEATALLLTGQTLSKAPSTSMTALLGLAPGARGPQVTVLQRILMSAGIALTGGADGVFGPATSQALRQFQGQNQLSQSGVVDAVTATALDAVVIAPGPDQGTPSAPSAPSTPSTPAPAPSAPAGSFPKIGDRGPQVAELQRALIAAGIPVPGGADGIFGSMTAGAVIAFQRHNGLPVNGVVDAEVAALLGLSAHNDAAAPSTPSMPTVALVQFPVQGRCSFADTWHYPRGGGRLHLGVDVMAPEGKLIYAVTDGTITRVYREGTNTLTGNGLRLTMDDGTYFFYAHLKDIAQGIAVDTKVVAGQILGTNGKTGNAGVPHLHFEIHPGGGSPVNPYPYIKAVDGCQTTEVPPQP
jgi:peptidoglycan hydrolase-like protein with peptidoglycan-binding domain